MRRIIRVVIFVIGTIISLYGAINDYEPVTLIGAFLMVLAVMLNVIIKAFKK